MDTDIVRRIVTLSSVYLRLEVRDKNGGLAIARVEREAWIRAHDTLREKTWDFISRRFREKVGS